MRLNLQTLRIGLSPGSVEMAAFDWRGRPRRTAQYPFERGPNGWKAAAATLRTQLHEGQWKAGAAQIVLSSHFVRHCLLPAELCRSSAAEQATYIKHVFRAEYGDAVDGWRIATDAAGNRARLACAIDAALFDELSGACRETGVKLRSVLPSLAAAVNAGRTAMQAPSAWVAVLEDRLCMVGLLEAGCWRHIARLRMGRISGEAILRLLREQEIALGQKDTVRTLYVSGAQREAVEEGDLGDWTIGYLPAVIALPRPPAS